MDILTEIIENQERRNAYYIAKLRDYAMEHQLLFALVNRILYRLPDWSWYIEGTNEFWEGFWLGEDEDLGELVLWRGPQNIHILLEDGNVHFEDYDGEWEANVAIAQPDCIERCVAALAGGRRANIG